MVENPEPIYVSVKVAAGMLGIHTWSVYKLLEEQEIESRYFGRRRLVILESLRAFAESLPATSEEATTA